VLLAVAAWNLVSYWPLLIVSLPGLSIGRAALANEMSTAVANTVPAGGAAGLGVTMSLYRAWGFSPEAITRSLVVAGAWNNFVKLATPMVAVVVATVWSDEHPPVALSLISVAALMLMVTGFRAALSGGEVMRRAVGTAQTRASAVTTRLGRAPVAGWVEALDRFRATTRDIVAARWLQLSATAILSHLSLFAVLLTSMWTLGLSGVSAIEAFVAFSVVRVALLLPITPGGAGLAELGLVGLLVQSHGNRADALAVVLVFRALTWVLPIALGALSYAVWLWQRRRTWPR
jgi:uncharacterized membrane protein YbhN (UPF0104 family)